MRVEINSVCSVLVSVCQVKVITLGRPTWFVLMEVGISLNFTIAIYLERYFLSLFLRELVKNNHVDSILK